MTGYSVVLPRRAVRQPQPCVNAGGDCGACVLAGLLGLGSVSEPYTRFGHEGKVAPFDYYAMCAALNQAEGEGLLERLVTGHPQWPVFEALGAWGAPAWLQSLEWFDYLTMALEAGYYGVTQVDQSHRGPLGDGTNHWVLLCGVRNLPPAGTGAYTTEVLVSNSAGSSPAEEWVGHNTFLRDWGGFNVFLARPR